MYKKKQFSNKNNGFLFFLKFIIIDDHPKLPVVISYPLQFALALPMLAYSLFVKEGVEYRIVFCL
jgi:hypothetical protein